MEKMRTLTSFGSHNRQVYGSRDCTPSAKIDRCAQSEVVESGLTGWRSGCEVCVDRGGVGGCAFAQDNL